MKLHLVDGTYELFRAYFGAPAAQAADGREVGASRALLRSLLSLLGEKEVTHVGVAFDTTVESFRNELFADYKTGEGMEPELFSQFPLAEEVAEALGMVVWRMTEFEADDALAAAAHRFADHSEVDQVVICSPDKDMYQCVRGNEVVSLDRMRRKTMNDTAVFEKLGVKPAQIPDYLALVGDTADGIPGIPRWGAKSTAAVLQAYSHIEDIPDDDGAWSVKVRGAKTLAANLASARGDATLYRTLATLRTDVPMEETLEDLAWRGADRQALTALCADIGESTALSRVNRWRE